MEGAEARAKRNLVITHIVLIIMAFIMLVPFAWMVLTALKTNQESISVNPFYIFPHNGWHWENFGTVWKSYNFIVLYKNTILMIFFRVLCACLTATMAGYAFGRLKFPGKRVLFSLVVTYLLKTGYEGLPKELEEAASIDGCSVPGRFLHIMMPLTRSSMVSLGIFTAVFAFKDLMWPMIVCTNANTTTLSAGLAKMQGQYGSEYPTMMAAATLAVLPMVIIYVIFQKQFVEGIATSGGKL